MTLNDLTENMAIQVKIIDSDATGEIRDALYYSKSEWEKLKQVDLDKDKADRVTKIKNKIAEMSIAPAKTSSDYSEEYLIEMAKLEGIAVEKLKERLDG